VGLSQQWRNAEPAWAWRIVLVLWWVFVALMVVSLAGALLGILVDN
jgi:hypothetical protein